MALWLLEVHSSTNKFNLNFPLPSSESENKWPLVIDCHETFQNFNARASVSCSLCCASEFELFREYDSLRYRQKVYFGQFIGQIYGCWPLVSRQANSRYIEQSVEIQIKLNIVTARMFPWITEHVERNIARGCTVYIDDGQSANAFVSVISV